MEYCHASKQAFVRKFPVLLRKTFPLLKKLPYNEGRASFVWSMIIWCKVVSSQKRMWGIKGQKGMKKKENSSFMVALPPAVPICLSAHCSFSRLRLLKNAQLRLVRKNRHRHDYHYYGAPSSYDTPPSFPYIYFCIYHCVYLVYKYIIFILYVSPKF